MLHSCLVAKHQISYFLSTTHQKPPPLPGRFPGQPLHRINKCLFNAVEDDYSDKQNYQHKDKGISQPQPRSFPRAE